MRWAMASSLALVCLLGAIAGAAARGPFELSVGNDTEIVATPAVLPELHGPELGQLFSGGPDDADVYLYLQSYGRPPPPPPPHGPPPPDGHHHHNITVNCTATCNDDPVSFGHESAGLGSRNESRKVECYGKLQIFCTAESNFTSAKFGAKCDGKFLYIRKAGNKTLDANVGKGHKHCNHTHGGSFAVCEGLSKSFLKAFVTPTKGPKDGNHKRSVYFSKGRSCLGTASAHMRAPPPPPPPGNHSHGNHSHHHHPRGPPDSSLPEDEDMDAWMADEEFDAEPFDGEQPEDNEAGPEDQPAEDDGLTDFADLFDQLRADVEAEPNATDAVLDRLDAALDRHGKHHGHGHHGHHHHHHPPGPPPFPVAEYRCKGTGGSFSSVKSSKHDDVHAISSFKQLEGAFNATLAEAGMDLLPSDSTAAAVLSSAHADLLSDAIDGPPDNRHPWCTILCNGKKAWMHGKLPCIGEFLVHCSDGPPRPPGPHPGPGPGPHPKPGPGPHPKPGPEPHPKPPGPRPPGPKPKPGPGPEPKPPGPKPDPHHHDDPDHPHGPPHGPDEPDHPHGPPHGHDEPDHPHGPPHGHDEPGRPDEPDHPHGPPHGHDEPGRPDEPDSRHGHDDRHHGEDQSDDKQEAEVAVLQQPSRKLLFVSEDQVEGGDEAEREGIDADDDDAEEEGKHKHKPHPPPPPPPFEFTFRCKGLWSGSIGKTCAGLVETHLQAGPKGKFGMCVGKETVGLKKSPGLVAMGHGCFGKEIDAVLLAAPPPPPPPPPGNLTKPDM